MKHVVMINNLQEYVQVYFDFTYNRNQNHNLYLTIYGEHVVLRCIRCTLDAIPFQISKQCDTFNT